MRKYRNDDISFCANHRCTRKKLLSAPVEHHPPGYTAFLCRLRWYKILPEVLRQGEEEEGRKEMYPYHNKIKQRIKAGELIGYEFIENYNGQGERLVLEFNTPPFIRPIKPERYAEYSDILVEWKRRRGEESCQ